MADLKKELKSLFNKAQKQVNYWRKYAQDARDEQKKVPANKEVKAVQKTKTEKIKVDISATSVARATLVVIGIILLLLLVNHVRSTVFLFLVALFLTAALSPIVTKLEDHRIPRWAGILLIYIVGIFLLGFTLTQFIPLVAEQIVEIAKSAKNGLESLISSDMNNPFFNNIKPIAQDFLNSLDIKQIQGYAENIGQSLLSFAGSSVSFLTAVFSNLFNFLIVLIFTFFLSLEKGATGDFFQSLLPHRYAKYASHKMSLIEDKIGAWMIGQLIVCVVIGVLIWAGMGILGVKYAVTLGFIAAVMELIPYLGPFLAGIPAVLVAVNQDPWLGVWALVFFVVIQTLEGNFIVPIIMKKAVGLPPVVIMISMMIFYSLFSSIGSEEGGNQFFGILGIIMSVPIATSLKLFVDDFQDKEKK